MRNILQRQRQCLALPQAFTTTGPLAATILEIKKKKFLEENSELLCLLSGLIYYFENEPEVNVKFTCY